MELTSYELLDVMASWKAGTASGLTSLMSMLSAYLLVAYFAGTRLTRTQILIISGLLLWFSSITIYQIAINLRTLAELNALDYEKFGAHADVVTWANAGRWIVVSGCISSLLAAFYFMWSVRQAKTE